MEWLPCVKLVNSSYVLFSTFTSPLGHTEFSVLSDYFLSPDKTSKTHKGGRRTKPVGLSKLEKEFIVSRVWTGILLNQRDRDFDKNGTVG